MNNFSQNSNRTQAAALVQNIGEPAPKKCRKMKTHPTESELNQKWKNILEKTIEHKDTHISESLSARISAILEKSII
jgi:hypothetical protein